MHHNFLKYPGYFGCEIVEILDSLIFPHWGFVVSFVLTGDFFCRWGWAELQISNSVQIGFRCVYVQESPVSSQLAISGLQLYGLADMFSVCSIHAQFRFQSEMWMDRAWGSTLRFFPMQLSCIPSFLLLMFLFHRPETGCVLL